MKKIKEFLRKKDVILSPKRYFVDAMSGMALGLFATLLLGTILKTIGTQAKIDFLIEMGGYAVHTSGIGMAIGIGYKLKTPPLVLFSLCSVGYAANTLGGAGGPLVVFIVAVISGEIGKLVSGETKLDILVTPLVVIFIGVGLSMLIASPVGGAVSSVGNIIMWATERQPLIMGFLIGSILGICLTLPISSAAICASLGLIGLAGGAGVAGCSAQMIGFAIFSYRDNKVGGLVSQGLGTSMLQMPNIIKKPILFLPIILISGINGAISSAIFGLEMNGAAISSGMGTSGLVGQIGVYSGWITSIEDGIKASISFNDVFGLIMISFIIPAALAFISAILLRKFNILKDGDLKLELGAEKK